MAEKLKFKLPGDREKYFEVGRKIGSLVDRRFEKLISEGKINFPEKKEVIEYMYEKKRGSQKLRPNIVFGSYCVFLEQDPLNILSNGLEARVVDIMTCVELSNIAHYAQNIIHDGKRGVLERSKINDRRKAVLCVNSYLSDAIKLAGQQGNEYLSTILNINDLVLRSFTPEIVMQNNRKEYLQNDDLFKKQFYEILSGGGVGRFFSNCIKLGYLMSGKNKTEKTENTLKSLEDIFYDFGIASEELNALSDFMVPKEKDYTREKDPSDQLADLREGIITPPIRMLYQKSNKEECDFLDSIYRNGSNNLKDHKKVLRMLFEADIYEKISKEIKKTGRKLGKRISKIDVPRQSKWFIHCILTILESNKIYKYLENDYKSLGLEGIA